MGDSSFSSSRYSSPAMASPGTPWDDAAEVHVTNSTIDRSTAAFSVDDLDFPSSSPDWARQESEKHPPFSNSQASQQTSSRLPPSSQPSRPSIQSCGFITLRWTVHGWLFSDGLLGLGWLTYAGLLTSHRKHDTLPPPGLPIILLWILSSFLLLRSILGLMALACPMEHGCRRSGLYLSAHLSAMQSLYYCVLSLICLYGEEKILRHWFPDANNRLLIPPALVRWIRIYFYWSWIILIVLCLVEVCLRTPLLLQYRKLLLRLDEGRALDDDDDHDDRDDDEADDPLLTPSSRLLRRPWWWQRSRQELERDYALREGLLDTCRDQGIPDWVSSSAADRGEFQEDGNVSGFLSGASPPRRRGPSRRRAANSSSSPPSSWWWPWGRPSRTDPREDGSVDFASVQEEWASRTEEDPFWWSREHEQMFGPNHNNVSLDHPSMGLDPPSAMETSWAEDDEAVNHSFR